MKLLDFLKQKGYQGMLFKPKYLYGSDSERSSYFLCECGAVNLIEMSHDKSSFYRHPKDEQQCQACQTVYHYSRDCYHWPSVQSERSTVLEILQLNHYSEEALEIKCFRLSLPFYAYWNPDRIKACLNQTFECYERAIHSLDGVLSFQHPQSELSHDQIIIGDTSYEITREKGRVPELIAKGSQLYPEYEPIRPSGREYFLSSYFKRDYFIRNSEPYFLLQTDAALKTHAVCRRHAFYALDWAEHLSSIGHFFHIFHYFHWMLEVYPAFEQIAKSGYHAIVAHWMEQYYLAPTKRYQVYKSLKRGTKESQIIAVPVFIRRWLKETNATFETYKKLLQIHEVSPIGEETFNLFLEIEHRLDLTRLWRIIRDQHATFNEIMQYLNLCETRQAVPHGEALILWDDYLNMAKRCNLPAKKFPPSVKLAHDVMLKNFNEIGDMKYAESFAQQAEVNKQWEYQDESLGFALIVPKTVRELIEEGRTLRHCVGSYDKRVAKGQTVILFLRQISDLTKPLYTVEWNPKTREIVQARAKMNGSIHDSNALALLDQFKAKFA